MPEMKKCSHCGEFFPETLQYFCKSRTGKNGLHAKCKECRKELNKPYKRSSYERNRESSLKYMSNWQKAHKGSVNTKNQRYRTKKNELPSDLTVEQWDNCLVYFDHKDAYTGLPLKIVSQDHVVPLSRGGEYTINNIIPCEKSVNSSKGNKDFFKWYPNQPFYSKDRELKILSYLNYDPKTHIQQLTFAI